MDQVAGEDLEVPNTDLESVRKIWLRNVSRCWAEGTKLEKESYDERLRCATAAKVDGYRRDK